MQDEVFGRTAPFGKVMGNWPIRVGDSVVQYRPMSEGHEMVVLAVNGNKLTVVEGNYNGKVHWGRVIDRSSVNEVWTRRWGVRLDALPNWESLG